MRAFVYLLFIFVLFADMSQAIYSKSVTKKKNSITVENKVTECKNGYMDLGLLVLKPNEYLNKIVCLKGEFNTFGNLALEYPKVYKSKKEYVSFTVMRPETQIPLSELKIVYNIKKAEKHPKLIKLKKHTDIQFKAKVISTALNEPWVEVSELEIN